MRRCPRASRCWVAASPPAKLVEPTLVTSGARQVERVDDDERQPGPGQRGEVRRGQLVGHGDHAPAGRRRPGRAPRRRRRLADGASPAGGRTLDRDGDAELGRRRRATPWTISVRVGVERRRGRSARRSACRPRRPAPAAGRRSRAARSSVLDPGAGRRARRRVRPLSTLETVATETPAEAATVASVARPSAASTSRTSSSSRSAVASRPG